MNAVYTYPEMNRKIVRILRVSDEPMCLYAAKRIEELEQKVTCEAFNCVHNNRYGNCTIDHLRISQAGDADRSCICIDFKEKEDI